jgi:hypothetical protein
MSRVAPSMSAPIAPSESISEWCTTAACVNASIDVTHTNAASSRSRARIRFDQGIDRRAIAEADRKYRWPLGRRPDDHAGLSDLDL